MLDRLSADELDRFSRIALEQGERAALVYFVAVTEPSE